MSTQGTRSDHITRTRQATTALLDALDDLRSLQKSWDAGMGTWITQDDFDGANDGLTKTDISAVSTTSLDAIDDLLAAGGNAHATNLEKIRL